MKNFAAKVDIFLFFCKKMVKNFLTLALVKILALVA